MVTGSFEGGVAQLLPAESGPPYPSRVAVQYLDTVLGYKVSCLFRWLGPREMGYQMMAISLGKRLRPPLNLRRIGRLSVPSKREDSSLRIGSVRLKFFIHQGDLPLRRLVVFCCNKHEHQIPTVKLFSKAV